MKALLASARLPIVIVGVMLQEGGFVKGSQIQPESAVNTIAILLFVGTAGLLLIALWQAVTFHLNKRTHKIFVDEVDRLKAHGLKQNVTPETRRVVEDLTGYAYEDLWNEPQKTGAKLHRPAQVN